VGKSVVNHHEPRVVARSMGTTACEDRADDGQSSVPAVCASARNRCLSGSFASNHARMVVERIRHPTEVDRARVSCRRPDRPVPRRRPEHDTTRPRSSLPRRTVRSPLCSQVMPCRAGEPRASRASAAHARTSVAHERGLRRARRRAPSRRSQETAGDRARRRALDRRMLPAPRRIAAQSPASIDTPLSLPHATFGIGVSSPHANASSSGRRSHTLRPGQHGMREEHSIDPRQ